MAARTHLRRSVIAAAAALMLAPCGSDKQPPPFKEVPQASTTTSGTTPGATTGTSGSVTITNLPPRYARTLGPLVEALDALDGRAQAVADATPDAQALANRVAAGDNPPNGAAPSIVRLRDALGSFSDALQAMATTTTLLPRLSEQLGVRSAELAKKHPADAARLATTRQRAAPRAPPRPAQRSTMRSTKGSKRWSMRRDPFSGLNEIWARRDLRH